MANEIQSGKTEVLIASNITVASNTTTVGFIDTLGWDYAKINTVVGTGSTSVDTFVTIALSEGTNSAAATSIVAFTGGTSVVADSTGFVIPAFNSSAPSAVTFNVDLTKRERYLKMTVMPGATNAVSSVAILTRGREAMPGSDVGSASKIVIG